MDVTVDQLPALSLRQLAELYNRLSGSAIRKFQDRAVALARVSPLVRAEEARRAAEAAVPAGVGEAVRALVRAGLSNAEIRERLGFVGKRAHYPGWYRWDMKRRGIA